METLPIVSGPHASFRAEDVDISPHVARFMYRLWIENSSGSQRGVIIRLTHLADGWEWNADGYSSWGRQVSASDAMRTAIEFIEDSYRLPRGTLRVTTNESE